MTYYTAQYFKYCDKLILYVPSPQISRKDVDEYKQGQRIPECQLIVQWEREDQRPVPLKHKVNLIGATAPHNFIYLTLYPSMEGRRSQYLSLYLQSVCSYELVMSHQHTM